MLTNTLEQYESFRLTYEVTGCRTFHVPIHGDSGEYYGHEVIDIEELDRRIKYLKSKG